MQRREITHRQSGPSRLEGRLGRTTRFEYVNRAGEPVHPNTGKPYVRPSASHVQKENGNLAMKNKHLPVKTTGAMFGGLEPIPTDPAVDPPPRACFNCWQLGHSRRKCPKPKVARMCNNCGRRGQDLTSCPRCSRGHKKFLEKLRARERARGVGVAIENDDDLEQLFAQEESEDEENACDEVLQELIVRDQIAREQRELMERSARDPNYQERQIGMAVFHEWNRYEEVEEPPSIKGRLSRSAHEERELLARQERERERERLEQERELAERERLEKEKERERLERERLERERIREREYERQRERERERERNRDREQRQVHHEQRRVREHENGGSRLETTHATPAHSSSKITDPVKDFLDLVKSITHLAPETQDLVMRQVIAERKEQAKLKAVQERENDDPWS